MEVQRSKRLLPVCPRAHSASGPRSPASGEGTLIPAEGASTKWPQTAHDDPVLRNGRIGTPARPLPQERPIFLIKARTALCPPLQALFTILTLGEQALLN